jgi:CBS domain-containing protein
MNEAPLTVRKDMSAARVHRTFVTLGMRHLCVVNNHNHVIGIITRKDLVRAAHDGHGPESSVQVAATRMHSRDTNGAGGADLEVSAQAAEVSSDGSGVSNGLPGISSERFAARVGGCLADDGLSGPPHLNLGSQPDVAGCDGSGAICAVDQNS